jgi:hypothetical protein
LCPAFSIFLIQWLLTHKGKKNSAEERVKDEWMIEMMAEWTWEKGLKRKNINTNN